VRTKNGGGSMLGFIQYVPIFSENLDKKLTILSQITPLYFGRKNDHNIGFQNVNFFTDNGDNRRMSDHIICRPPSPVHETKLCSIVCKARPKLAHLHT
jgi:hypothetical protein